MNPIISRINKLENAVSVAIVSQNDEAIVGLERITSVEIGKMSYSVKLHEIDLG